MKPIDENDEGIVLSGEQASVLDAARGDSNLLITGGAGVGKSVLVDAIDKSARKNGKSVLKCAFTGIAAKNIGGSTIHSLFGLEKGVAPKASKSEVIENADMIIFDEVSTVRCDVMDSVLECVHDVNASRPSGTRRLKVLLFGDLFQLGPVSTPHDRAVINQLYGGDMGMAYPYRARLWSGLELESFELTEVFRQENPEFAKALNKVRVGDYAGVDWIYENCSRELPEGAVKLMGRNKDVKAANQSSLEAIGKKVRCFEHEVHGVVDNVRFPEELRLCEGARVMTLANNPKLKYANGSLGTVVGFDAGCVQVKLDGSGDIVSVERVEDECVKPVIKELNGKKVVENMTVGSQIQFPLKLAYALTIHKCQGLSLDKLAVDPACFCPGQLYVALSRARSLDGLYLTGKPRPSDLKVDPSVQEFMESIRSGA